VQNQYNLAHREDDALIDTLAEARDRLCAVLPARRLLAAPVERAVDGGAERLGATPMQVALAWLLQRAPNILLIPGTSSLGHLRENLAVQELRLPENAVAVLDGIAG
jgi:pyridoxine 4-dehydrogenase